MTQNDIDHYIMASLQEGLPICSRPYAALARELKLTEQQIVDRIQWLKDNDYIRRYGIIVRHKELGFHANAMVVWDIADDQVTNIGNQLALQSSVTLCYQRPRRLPEWRYNLFSMIHGHDRQEVLNKIETIEQELNLTDVPHKPLFSQRRFKQRGGRLFTFQKWKNKPLIMRKLEDIDIAIIRYCQDGFPLSERPYREVAQTLKITEDELISRLKNLLNDKILSRFGPMFNADQLGGAFSLCAIQVPTDQWETVVEQVNGFAEVAHNYQREHSFNMWYVLATETKQEIDVINQKIEEKTGLTVYNFPKLKEFYVGLRFSI